MEYGEIISVLNNGGVVVLKTDTLYGIVSRADTKDAVDRIYTMKMRDENKPLIVLVSSLEQIEAICGVLPPQTHTFLEALWPAPVSVRFPVSEDVLPHVHRGAGSIAFRLPDDTRLREILSETGPVVAPSANIAGALPARSIAEARAYFGDQVDLYVEDDPVEAETPSTLIAIDDDGVSCLRNGAIDCARIQSMWRDLSTR